MEGVREVGFIEMTPIQKVALPITLSGRDLIGQAQTGTGKTAAFLITLFTRIMNMDGERGKIPAALILSPTRELALQTYKEAVTLGGHTGLRFGVFFGGKDYRKQEMTLERGVDIAIGTPGRVLDFIRQRRLRVDRIAFLVIDEADRLMDLGFQEELWAIFRRLPPPEKRQSLLFSATIDARTRQIAGRFMVSPALVEIEPEHITAEGIEEMVYHVERETKFRMLLTLLLKEEVPRGMIFANTKVVAGLIAEKLKRNGFSAELMTGDLAQNTRIRILDGFREGNVPLLVCSDVASRGLHIDNVTHIFNYDVPQDPEDYVHRIGRTARAGKTGKAYTLACDEYVFNLPAIETLIKRRIPFEISTAEELVDDNAVAFDMRAYKRLMRSQGKLMGKRRSGRRPGAGRPGPRRRRR